MRWKRASAHDAPRLFFENRSLSLYMKSNNKYKVLFACPESNNKRNVLFACPKSTKRTKRGRNSSFELLPHTRLSRRKYCVASECGRRAKQKNQVCLSPWLSLYHACEHITRKNRADSRMRKSTPAYKGVAGVHEVCALTEPRC